MKRNILAAALAFASVVAVQPALAQEAGTLKKITETKTLVIGFRESSVPFSYLDSNQKPIGYSMDICMKAVEAIKAKLKMPDLKVELQPVTSANRIPLLQNGTIDMECGSTTNSVKRQEQVSFANTTFVTNVKIVTMKNSGIKALADLDGQPIATTSGTTSVQLIKQNEKGTNVNFKEVYGKDHAESFLLLSTGRAKAFVMDDILIAGLIANSPNPGDYVFLPEVLRTEPYGVMLRKDDKAFKAVVDESVNGLIKSGEIRKMYAKWFQSAIPPKNANLNFPISPELEAAFAKPNDKGVE